MKPLITLIASIAIKARKILLFLIKIGKKGKL